ncbi:LOW QUALITY PROTEIN: uncharacterized protein [Takifugu rubripes]|uniref:LOW QUALITY PROTEIN: uncharacterized protein n=1 Tax=Takifugu rubripes TaxID=31033 RepID=UPI00114582CB|nr:LOW QUALITY PROTEIN: uncharacterized protein LOC115250816 [Takifugu rubripes]
MAVRRFEGKDHAAAYLQFRVAPQGPNQQDSEVRQPKVTSAALLQTTINHRTAPACVDVGCGPGQGTVLLAPILTKVVGIDVSPAQLEMALTKTNPPNVSYSQGPAEELPFGPGEVDLVTAMTAAHWFERRKFLVEADRVLRPGGCWLS